MIEKVSENIWKVKADSNAYFLDFEEKIMIDTGSRSNKRMFEQFLDKMVDFRNIEKVIFTHLHHDHIGNFDLFPNAVLLASKLEIADFKKDPKATILDEDMAGKFNPKLEIAKNLKELEVINTPGHTFGSICLWHPKEKILFSGDTLLKEGTGRTDLPTSRPELLPKSMIKLLKYEFKTLCPGHEY